MKKKTKKKKKTTKKMRDSDPPLGAAKPQRSLISCFILSMGVGTVGRKMLHPHGRRHATHAHARTLRRPSAKAGATHTHDTGERG